MALVTMGLAGCGDDDSGAPGGPGGPDGSVSADAGPAPPGPGVLEERTVGELLVPFDADQQDLVGPADHATQYGRRPSVIARPMGDTIDVLVQDFGDVETPRAVLLRLTPEDEGYGITAAVEVPILDRLMGFARDGAGAFYVASGVDEGESVTPEYPAEGAYRANVVRVRKLDLDGDSAFDTDLDTARAMVANDPEQVIHPMVAASARLAVGGGSAALVHGNNTEPDWDIEGARHQKALTTHLDATTGDVERTSSMWVSHSFDQRMLHDGQGFIEMHLGDAYPRWIVLGRVAPDSGPYPLFHHKGWLGWNNTFTRLGGIALIEDDPNYGYMATFATERSAGTEPLFEGEERIAGIRDLAVVRARRDFEAYPEDDPDLPHLDPDLPDTLTVTVSWIDGSGNEQQAERTNRLRWLTNYGSAETTTHVERPKLVAIGDNRFIALWETWERTGSGRNPYQFAGTHGILLDASGAPLLDAVELTGHHLPRGDDAFAVAGHAAWITGDRDLRVLRLHLVDDTLGYRQVVIE
jgi:hypothetical protein